MELFKTLSTELVKYEGNEACVEIPEEITAIGDFAFSDCLSIKNVVIPSSVTSIGSFAFYGCENLETVNIPDSVTLIGSGAFSWCPKLDHIIIPSSIKILPKSIFYKCANLKSIELANTIYSIEHSAFGLCKALKKIVLSDSLKYLGDGAFEGCCSLRDVTLSSSLEKIGNKVFHGCGKLRSLVLPESLKEVGVSAFETQGRISIISTNQLLVTPAMFDANWNVFITRKDDSLYQMENCYLPIIELKKWKHSPQIILLVNFLETYTMYDDEEQKNIYIGWCQENKEELLEFIFLKKRYAPLNQALEAEIFTGLDIEPYFDSVLDREEKAKLMEYRNKQSEKSNVLGDLEELLSMF